MRRGGGRSKQLACEPFPGVVNVSVPTVSNPPTTNRIQQFLRKRWARTKEEEITKEWREKEKKRAALLTRSVTHKKGRVRGKQKTKRRGKMKRRLGPERAAVRIQALWRGYSQRKKYRVL